MASARMSLRVSQTSASKNLASKNRKQVAFTSHKISRVTQTTDSQLDRLTSDISEAEDESPIFERYQDRLQAPRFYADKRNKYRNLDID